MLVKIYRFDAESPTLIEGGLVDTDVPLVARVVSAGPFSDRLEVETGAYTFGSFPLVVEGYAPSAFDEGAERDVAERPLIVEVQVGCSIVGGVEVWDTGIVRLGVVSAVAYDDATQRHTLTVDDVMRVVKNRRAAVGRKTYKTRGTRITGSTAVQTARGATGTQRKVLVSGAAQITLVDVKGRVRPELVATTESLALTLEKGATLSWKTPSGAARAVVAAAPVAAPSSGPYPPLVATLDINEAGGWVSGPYWRYGLFGPASGPWSIPIPDLRVIVPGVPTPDRFVGGWMVEVLMGESGTVIGAPISIGDAVVEIPETPFVVAGEPLEEGEQAAVFALGSIPALLMYDTVDGEYSQACAVFVERPQFASGTPDVEVWGADAFGEGGGGDTGDYAAPAVLSALLRESTVLSALLREGFDLEGGAAVGLSRLLQLKGKMMDVLGEIQRATDLFVRVLPEEGTGTPRIAGGLRALRAVVTGRGHQLSSAPVLLPAPKRVVAAGQAKTIAYALVRTRNVVGGDRSEAIGWYPEDAYDPAGVRGYEDSGIELSADYVVATGQGRLFLSDPGTPVEQEYVNDAALSVLAERAYRLHGYYRYPLTVELSGTHHGEVEDGCRRGLVGQRVTFDTLSGVLRTGYVEAVSVDEMQAATTLTVRALGPGETPPSAPPRTPAAVLTQYPAYGEMVSESTAQADHATFTAAGSIDRGGAGLSYEWWRGSTLLASDEATVTLDDVVHGEPVTVRVTGTGGLYDEVTIEAVVGGPSTGTGGDATSPPTLSARYANSTEVTPVEGEQGIYAYTSKPNALLVVEWSVEEDGAVTQSGAEEVATRGGGAVTFSVDVPSTGGTITLTAFAPERGLRSFPVTLTL